MRIFDKSIKIAKSLFPITRINRKQKFYHFAFIYRRNNLISIGENDQINMNNKAYYFGKRYNLESFCEYSYIHSEISAIAKCWGKYHIDSDLKMVVLRLSKSGKLKNSKPCKNCATIINALGIDRVWWSKDDETFGYGI